jgi:hypothetical protein
MVTEMAFGAPEGHAACTTQPVSKVGERLVCAECKDLPPNVKKHATIGRQADLPKGFLVFQDMKGSNTARLMVTPLGKFDPKPIASVEKVHGRFDVSDDGKWIIALRPWNQIILVAVDGSSVVEVPGTKDIKWHRDEESFVGFWHSYPGKASAIFVGSINTVYAMEVDLSKPQPTFGPLKVVAQVSGIGAGWMRDMGMAGKHAFGGLGAPYSMLTLRPGRDEPAGAADLWTPSGQARFACGCHLSWDGAYSCHNPGGVAKPTPLYDKAIPGGGAHTGPVILDFREAGSPAVEAGELEISKSASVNWAPREYYSGGHDWHEWHFTNNRHYLTGRLLWTPKGERQQYKGGIWLLHWPSSTWTQITPAELGGKGDRHVAYLTDAAMPAAAKPATAPAAGPTPASKPAKPADSAPSRVTIEATITHISKVPAQQELGVYQNVLTAIRYRVDKVVQGECGEKSLVLIHWAIRDRKPVEAAGYKVGQKQRIVCEPYDARKHADIVSVQEVNDIEDTDSRTFFALSVSALP